MTRIKLPAQLDGLARRSWAVELASASGSKDLTFDFSSVAFACPLGLLSIGREIRGAVRDRRQRRLISMVAGIDLLRPAHSFLNHIGFFDFIGLPNSKPIGAARGSDKYVPIRRFTRSELGDQTRASSRQLRETISAQAEGLAAMLVGSQATSGYWAVAYSVREVLRNVFEHSGVNECYVVAQKWANDSVEMAVVDEGMGIRASLSQAVPCASDAEALRHAVKPGVSRTMSLREAENSHGNSGFGLYVLSELGRCFGVFTLSSGDACLVAGSQTESAQEFTAMRGTTVGLKLASIPFDFSCTLDDIVDAGEAEAASHGLVARASSASRKPSIG